MALFVGLVIWFVAAFGFGVFVGRFLRSDAR